MAADSPLPNDSVFSKRLDATSVNPIYVGETGDLSTRFDSHHRQSCFDRSGVKGIGPQRTMESSV